MMASPRVTALGDHPVPGLYKIRLAKDAPWSPVKIVFGPPNDPDTGEPLDRSPRWQCFIRGELYPMSRVWPWCGRWPIEEPEYRYLMALKGWADEHALGAPEANPRAAVDLTKIPPLF